MCAAFAIAIVACSTGAQISPTPTSQSTQSPTSSSRTASTTHNPIDQPEATASEVVSPGASQDPDGVPTSVLGLPVVSVGELNHLIAGGRLDGRVAAVRGYWISSIIPSCPAPPRWYSPLEEWCAWQLLSDIAYDGAECHEESQGTACNGIQPPGGAETVRPIILDNYGVEQRITTPDFRHFEPVPVVLVGHAGDARYLQCQSDAVVGCRKAFVVDTVAWSSGKEWPVSMLDDQYTPQHSMSVDQVEQTVQGRLAMTTLVQGRDVPGIDPRLHVVGTDTYWVVRALNGIVDGNVARADVLAVNDTTGEVVDKTALDVAADYAPALLRTQATDPHACCPGGLQPIYRLSDQNGSPIEEGLIGGGGATGDDHSTRWLVGPAAVLDAGNYVLEGWHADVSGPFETWGPPSDTCEKAISLTSGQSFRIEAAFPEQGPCQWREPTFGESIY
jgi:hypothetical protein